MSRPPYWGSSWKWIILDGDVYFIQWNGAITVIKNSSKLDRQCIRCQVMRGLIGWWVSKQIHKCNLSWICLCNQLRVSPVCCLIELILNYSLNKIWGLRRFCELHPEEGRVWQTGRKKKYKTVLMTHAFQQKTLQKHHSSLSPKNCAINTFFHLFYRSASNDSLPLPLSFFRRLSSPSADSVQITSVLSLHSFIFHRRAKIAPCCSPSFAFITGAARERQQAAPSDPRLCCLLDCHVAGACWLGKFSGSHHTY